MRRIVIATDGSRPALEAVEFGLELASDQGAEPTFVHVAPASDVLPVSGFGTGPVSVAHELNEADRASLDEAVDMAEGRDLEARAVLLAGDPAHEIVRYADSIDADLIVVGSRGHSAIASPFIGSVSRGVLRAAKRPVLIVRGVSERLETPPAVSFEQVTP